MQVLMLKIRPKNSFSAKRALFKVKIGLNKWHNAQNLAFRPLLRSERKNVQNFERYFLLERKVYEIRIFFVALDQNININNVLEQKRNSENCRTYSTFPYILLKLKLVLWPEKRSLLHKYGKIGNKHVINNQKGVRYKLSIIMSILTPCVHPFKQSPSSPINLRRNILHMCLQWHNYFHKQQRIKTKK